jgi:hypothetical protein
MSYYQELKQRKNKKTQPEGRESWKGARSQAKGNIRWMLNNFEPEEIVSIMAEEEFKEQKNIYPAKKRYRCINILIEYLNNMKNKCESELRRMEKVSTFDDSSFKAETNSRESLEAKL